jgi:hypothetical protein
MSRSEVHANDRIRGGSTEMLPALAPNLGIALYIYSPLVVAVALSQRGGTRSVPERARSL